MRKVSHIRNCCIRTGRSLNQWLCRFHCFVVFLTWSCLFLSPTILRPAEAVKIKWTPGEERQPEYSMEDRQALLQLDKQISTSSNPQAALQQVAQSGGLEVSQLADILMENRKWFQEHGGLGAKQPLVSVILKTVTSTLAVLGSACMHRPQVATLLITSLVLAAWVAWNAPRNGVLLGGRGTLRPTTLFVPPTKFLEATMLDPEWWSIDDPLLTSYSSSDCQDVWRQINVAKERRNKKSKKKKKNTDVVDQIQWYSDFPKSKRGSSVKLSEAAAVELVADLESVFPPKFKGDDDDDSDDDGKHRLYQAILEDQAQLLLVIRPQLTEFFSPHKIKFFTSQPNEAEQDNAMDFALLVVPGLGKWGKIGYIPLVLSRHYGTDKDEKKGDSLETSDDKVLASLVLSPLPGTFWEGQDIHIRIMQQYGHNCVVQAALTTVSDDDEQSKKGKRKIPKKLANRIVESLCSSLQASLETRMRQAIARQEQSSRFASRAKLTAKERRQTRAARERQIEEMAADRRRRRYQQNPNQGRYRPSGERMHSPNNAVYK